MATILLTVKVAPDDVSAVVSAAVNLGYEAQQISPGDETSALVLVETMLVDDADRDAAVHQVRQRVASILDQQGVTHLLVGSGVDESSMTRSLFTIRPLDDDAGIEPLEVRADNRVEFQRRLAALHQLFRGEAWPPQDLDGYQVIVEGLAAGDPDVQEPPYVPKR